MTPEQKQAVLAWAEEVLEKWLEAEEPRCSDEFTPGTAYVEFDEIPAYRARLETILALDDWHKWPAEVPPAIDMPRHSYLVLLRLSYDGALYHDIMTYDPTQQKWYLGTFNGAFPVAYWRPLPDPPPVDTSHKT